MRALRLVIFSAACAASGAVVVGLPAFGQATSGTIVRTAPNAAPVAEAPVVTAPAAAASSAPAAKTGAPAAAKAAHAGKAMDRLDLEATQVTGNKELPKVMYVVPWKHSDLGDLTGKPANSLVDEVLQPVDRDVFNREERYYHTVAPEKSPASPQSGTAAQH
jgi:hypothetical protein